jgi:uncharacterized protein (TIGR02466 family)
MIEQVFKPAVWWPTPILLVQNKNTDQLNAGLARIILEKEKEIVSKGMPTPIAGLEEGLTTHWQEFNVLNWETPECIELRRLVVNGVREFFKLIGGNPDDPDYAISGISCWANVLRFGESLDIHHHDPGFVSAHYTVQTGKDDENIAPGSRDSGHTAYYRPGFLERSHGIGQATSPWDLDWRISRRPVAGNLLFFPSYVRHEVRPNLEKKERISIAMDIYIKKQKALIHFGKPRWFVPER